jgi:hypothetical protein
MVIGSVLLRPQKLQRAIAINPADTLTDDLINLITRLAIDASQGGWVLEAIAKAMTTLATQFVEQSGAGLSTAVDRFAIVFQPLIDRVTRLAESDLGELGQILDSAEKLLDWIVKFLQDIPTDSLRQQIAAVLDIMQSDLGITDTWIEDQVLALFDQMILQLQPAHLEETAEQKANRREVALILQRLQRYIRDNFTFPQFQSDQIATSLLNFFRLFSSSTRKAACVGTGLSKVLQAGQSLTDLIPYSSLTPFGSNSVGAAAAAAGSEEYCWYATWLLENENRGGFLFKIGHTSFTNTLDSAQISEALRNQFRDNSVPLLPDATVEVLEARKKWRITNGAFKYALASNNDGISVDLDVSASWFFRSLGFLGFPGDKVRVNRDKTQVLLGDRLLYEGTDVRWFDAPIFQANQGPRYTFKYADPEAMENWAYHSAWVSDGLEALLHLVSLETGDYASNTFNAVWNTTDLIVKLATKRPLFDYIGYGTWGIGIGGTILASLEGIQTKVSVANWFAFWFFVLLSSDLGEKALYNYWLNLSRNALLSFITLLNYEGSRVTEDFVTGRRDDDRPLNRKAVDGIVSVFVDLSLIWLADLVPKDKYIHPFASVDLTLGYGIGAALGMGLAGGFVGTVIAETIAWAEDWEVLGYSLIKSSLWSIARFWPYLYLLKEGDTDDGTYNPSGPAFSGYPDSNTSPYNFPYEAGRAILWGQCNQGMWSHNIKPGSRPQVYAFDLAMDQDDEVLAMRPGTVVDFFDWVIDDQDGPSVNRPAFPPGTPSQQGTTSRNWNFIMIRHDRNEDGTLIPAASLPPNPNPLNSSHDRDQGGARTVTYSVYGHGRNSSIRQIFANRLGIPPANILPNQIIGQPVARGQVIMGAGDTGVSFHNHLHIQVMSGPSTGAEVRLDQNTAPTGIPFVNGRTLPFVFREVDGVPKVLNSYFSQNVRQA